MPRSSHDDRFRTLVHRRLEPGETIVATARVWSARPNRFPALAARFRDDVVVTDRRLMVWECGWWTRRPRRRVLADRLDDIMVTGTTKAQREAGTHTVASIRVDHPGRPSLVFDIGADGASQKFAMSLLTSIAAHTGSEPA
jgi:hypothetical protein